MTKSWFWLTLPAALVTALLYPRFFGDWQKPPSDQAAIQSAHAILAQLGIDPVSYNFTVHRSFDENQYRLIRRFQPSRLTNLLSPLEIEVTAQSPQGPSRVKLVLNDALKPMEWSGQSLDASRLAPAPVWLTVFAGADTPCFGNPATKGGGSKTREQQQWSCRDTSSPDREARFTIEYVDKAPHEARLTLKSPGDGMVFEWPQDTFAVFGVLTMIVLAPAAFIFLVTRRKRHRDHLKSALKIALIYIAFSLVLLVLGLLPLMREDAKDEALGIFLGSPLQLVLTLASGFALVTGWQARSWLGLALLSGRRFFDKHLGIEVLQGFLLGPVISCAVVLCAWLAAPWGALPTLVPLDRLFGRFQFTTSASQVPSAGAMALFLFGVLAPWALRGQPSKWRQRLVAFCAIALSTLGLHPISGNGIARVAASAALIGLLWWGYRHLGLLAALVAIPASTIVPALALGFARRDGPAIASEALPALACLGAALALVRFGRAADVDALTAEIDRRNTPAAADVRPERERLLTEVSLAREAQQSLLPARPPELPGYAIAAACIPAGEVGGDLYDYLAFPSNRIALCVVDVSGKGVTASVYNTYAKGMLAALASRNASLETLAAELNGYFLETARRKTFFTLVLALLDPHTRSLRLLRLGHNPPLLHRAATGEPVWLRPPGLGVGLASNKALLRILKVDTLQLEPGDTLVLYSDGLTEAMNPDQELFGEDRLRATVARNAHLDAPVLNEILLREVEAFRNGAEPNDDLTLVTLRVSPS